MKNVCRVLVLAIGMACLWGSGTYLHADGAYIYEADYSGSEADITITILDAKANAVFSKQLGTMRAPYYWGKPHGLAMGTITEDPAVYLWQDADGWHVHIAASSVAHKYKGTIVTDGDLSGTGVTGKTLSLSYSGSEEQDINFMIDSGTFLLMTLMIDGKLVEGGFNAASYVYVGAGAAHPLYLPVNITLEKNSGHIAYEWDGLDQTGGLGVDGIYTFVVRAMGKGNGEYSEERVTFDYVLD